MATSPQWIRLRSGWVDLGHVGSIEEEPTGGLRLNSDIKTVASHVSTIVDGADADAVRAYLDKVAVNRSHPEPETHVLGDE